MNDNFTAKVKVLFHCYCGGIVPARLLGLAHWHDLDPCAAGWCQCLLSVIVLTSIYLCTSGAGVLSSQFGLDIQVDLPGSGGMKNVHPNHSSVVVGLNSQLPCLYFHE